MGRAITEEHVSKWRQRIGNAKPTECWEWPGTKDRVGYGMVTFWCPIAKNTRYVLAHRVAYFAANGTIPKGKDVMHLCHNKACCNPEHLRAGTRKQNMKTTIDDHRWPRLVPREDWPQIAQRQAAGETMADIGRTYGCSWGTIQSAIAAHYAKRKNRPADLRKRAVPAADYPSIFARRKAGETYGSIAKTYGITEAGIRRIFDRHGHQNLE